MESIFCRLLFFIIIKFCFLFSHISTGEELLLPDPSQSIEALWPSIQGITILDKQIILIPTEKNFFIEVPFKGLSGKTREENFGQAIDSKRHPYPEKFANRTIIDLSPKISDQLFFLERDDLGGYTALQKDFSFLEFNTFAWDLILPPRDRMGEPTQKEIKDIRQKIKKSWDQSGGQKWFGISQAPESWFGNQRENFLIWTHLPQFPLVNLTCQKQGELDCKLDRTCFVEGISDKDLKSMIGLGLHQEKKLLVTWHPETYELFFLKFHSCFNITLLGKRKISEKIPPILSVKVDSHGRLWVTTSRPEPFTNGSVFVWEKYIP